MGEEQITDEAGAVPAEWSLTTLQSTSCSPIVRLVIQKANVNTIRGQHYWRDSRKQAWEEKQVFKQKPASID